MSIASEIARLQQAKADIAEAIVAKGGEVSGTIDNYAQAIEALPSGGEHGILEGEVTFANNKSHSVTITHNLGVVPQVVSLEIISDYTPATSYVTRNVAGVKNDGSVEGYVQFYAVSLTSFTINISANNTFDDTKCIINTSGTSRRFFAATYKYKIYY